MAQVCRVAIIAALFVIVSVTAAMPHRHDPGQDDAGNAGCAACLGSHNLPLVRPALTVHAARGVVAIVALPVVRPFIPQQISRLAFAPGTSPPAPIFS